MISSTIFKHTLKENYKLWLIITLITSAFLGILIAVFKPATIADMTGVVQDTALSGLLSNTTFLGMLSSTFYSLQGVILPIIFIIMTANSLIASQVDKGSLAYILSTPVKRSTVVCTQAFYFILSLLAMFIIITVVGVIAIQVFQGDVDINMKDFILLNVGLFLLMFATSSISFFFSCVFNLSKNSLALGAGVPLAFFLFEMMSSINESLENFKYISMNSMFNREAILNHDSYLIWFILLAIIGFILYFIGMRIFVKKDLPL